MEALAQEKRPQDQPLFGSLAADDDDTSYLPGLTVQQQVTEDYRTLGLSLRAHPVSFYRQALDSFRVTTADGLNQAQNGRHLRVAGLVIMRQRPATAKGITFVTLEDETGTCNLVIKPKIWQRYYQIARRSPAWIAHGKLEKRSGVIHVVINRLEDLSDRMQELGIKSRDFR